MRLSDEKIDLLARRIVDRLWDDDLIDFKMRERDLYIKVAQVVRADLTIEDEISNEAIERIESYKRDIPYGTEEWRLLYDRFFNEIAERRGYTV